MQIAIRAIATISQVEEEVTLRVTGERWMCYSQSLGHFSNLLADPEVMQKKSCALC